MDLSKIGEYFSPVSVRERIHIIGCGSIGSTVAENLARCGLINFTLWDFDLVETHNIVNQMFRLQDVGRNKAEALLDILSEINPDVRAKAKIKKDGWNGEPLSGYVFLAVDSIDLRRRIVEGLMQNKSVVAVFDFRTGLEDAQYYAARWSSLRQRESLLGSMNFSDGDVKEETSACGIVLGVCPTVRTVCAIGCANFMNLVRGKEIITFAICAPFGGRMVTETEQGVS